MSLFWIVDTFYSDYVQTHASSQWGNPQNVSLSVASWVIAANNQKIQERIFMKCVRYDCDIVSGCEESKQSPSWRKSWFAPCCCWPKGHEKTHGRKNPWFCGLHIFIQLCAMRCLVNGPSFETFHTDNTHSLSKDGFSGSIIFFAEGRRQSGKF